MFIMFGDYHLRADRIIAVKLHTTYITAYTCDDKEYHWYCYSEKDAQEKRAEFLMRLNKALKNT